jgi:hypothetical protein
MNPVLRRAQWAVVAAAVLLLFWVAASVGGWSPDLRRLTISVHAPLVADYRADSPLTLAPLSPDITRDASQDQTDSAHPSTSPPPGASPSGGPSPTGSGGGSPSPSATGSGSPLPTLPVPTPSLPVPTPSLPVATPTPLVTPTLPTPPPIP